MKNVEIRVACISHGIKQWELAKELGISESHFSRKLRYELPPEEKKRILSVIEKMAKDVDADA